MLIIFDCDGVLRSASWKGLFKAYIALIEQHGKNWKDFFQNFEEFKKWWDPDWYKNSERIGIKDIKEANKIFYEYYEPYISVFPWVSDILSKLSARHILTLLSNTSEESAKKSLGQSVKYFSLVVGSEHLQRLKPDPEGIHFILERIKTPPSQTLKIGDMAIDILAGKRAGVKTGAVCWGLGNRKELRKLKPDYIFRKPKDLLSI